MKRIPDKTGFEYSHDFPRDYTKPPLEFFELFAGCGGFALGLKGAGFEPAYMVERDKAPCETYEKNLEHKAICLSVEEFAHWDFVYRNTAGVVAGFPCTTFSRLGARKGTEDPTGQLYKFVLSAIERCQPHWWIVENVPQIADEGNIAILRELANTGDYVATFHHYKLKECGIPQNRERIIWVSPYPRIWFT